MASSLDSDVSYRALSDAVAALARDANCNVYMATEEGLPLIVLESPSDVVGFTIVAGTPERAFKDSYEAFKKLYRRQHSVWSELNLSFVVCRSKFLPEHDAFFSALETDVYFCRKYVIFQGENPGEMATALLRLPFFPFPERTAGGFARPTPAREFIRSLGASAQFARQIVVPREYSAATIADELLRTAESLPDLGDGVATEGLQHTGPNGQTRIKSVTIDAFRAYKKPQVFDVDADVIVLYGPNGLGKTSFFDALDYVSTGRIGRLCQHRTSHDDFIGIARHLGAPSDRGAVSIELLQGDRTTALRRTLSDWGQAWTGIEGLDRVSALQLLTSAKWGDKPARIENLEKLFRATHLFSQSTPELLSDFDKDSKLSFEIASRMLALDDYASALSKIGAVLAHLNKALASHTKDEAQFDDQMSRVRANIQAILVPGELQKAGRHLTEIAGELASDLRSDASIDIGAEEVTAVSVREWRAMIEAAVAHADEIRKRAQRSESGFSLFDKNRSALSNAASQLRSTEADLTKVRAREKQTQDAIRERSRTIEDEQRVLTQAKDRLNSLSQLDGLKTEHDSASEALKRWQEAASQAANEMTSIAGELKPLSEEVDTRGLEIVERKRKADAESERIRQLRAIQDGIPSWDSNRGRLAELDISAKTVATVMAGVAPEISTLQTRAEKAKGELAQSEHAYAAVSSQQEELAQLLDRIEGFVAGNNCPTCGTPHASKALLLEKIQAQKVTRSPQLESLTKSCGELRARIKETNEALQIKENELQAHAQTWEQIAKELSSVRQELVAFESRMRDAGLNPEDRGSGALDTIMTDVAARFDKQTVALSELEGHTGEARKRISFLETKQKEKVAAYRQASEAARPLEEGIAAVQAKAEAMGLSLETAPEDAARRTNADSELRTKTEERLAHLTKEREGAENEVRAAAARIEELSRSSEIVREDQAEFQAQIEQYEENAAPLLKRDDISEETVVELRIKTEERVSQLTHLRTRCLNLERALDAEQRSAALASLEADLADLTKKKDALSKTKKRTGAALKWLKVVKTGLDNQSSSAVAEHVNSLGPLTTLIQQRLRAVYGFGDVSLDTKGNDIRVLVGWGKQQFRPSDYFSDSQKQILMLSLFLAGRITQTWSGFSAILMDDPVTHFDDLNAFGFVELIRGMVTTLPGKRQFFISTCEERLFDLMRRKFRGIAGGAKFYHFTGMDADGPVVNPVE